MILISICGARPNFMKIAPLAHALKGVKGLKHIIVHTGQHYDAAMSDTFFRQLNIPKPDVNLNAGSGSHAVQTARVMEAFEAYLLKNKFQDRDDVFVIVVGDVNSTMACAITAKKLHLKVIHYEGGLRSFDRTMPEEINRLATDAIADLFFVTEGSAVRNLLAEGHPRNSIHLVGNLMIDTLVANKARAEATGKYRKLGLENGEFALLTMHRPSNVDDPKVLKDLMYAFNKICAWCPIVYPIHPRTEANLKKAGLYETFGGIDNMMLTQPLGYHEMLNLQMHCKFIMTDSGGVQEEASVLKKPCLTMRDNTERPSTTELGSSILVGNSPIAIIALSEIIREGKYKPCRKIPLWDGKSVERIVKCLQAIDQNQSRG